MMIAQVNYASPQQRLKSLESYLKGWVDIAKGITDDKLYLAAYVAFDAMKTLALVTKHCGFSEEHEWRAIYVPERDPRRYLESSLDYFVGPRGVEPRLKFKFGDAEAKDGSSEKLTTGTLSDLLHFYPAGSDCLIAARKKAFERMLKRIGKGQFIDRVYPSTIPLRPEQ